MSPRLLSPAAALFILYVIITQQQQIYCRSVRSLYDLSALLQPYRERHDREDISPDSYFQNNLRDKRLDETKITFPVHLLAQVSQVSPAGCISYSQAARLMPAVFDSMDGPVINCPTCGSRHVPFSGSLPDGVYSSSCQHCGQVFKFQTPTAYLSSISLKVNGVSYTVGNSEYDGTSTLADFLRKSSISLGTKVMCWEGGCGACVVTATYLDIPTRQIQSFAINACTTPLFVCHNWEITTIEGLGSKRKGYHPIQKRVASYHGSQCGYCSPAQVMNMYSLLQKNASPTEQEVEDAFDGIICRCTGYRPILDAMKSFAINSDPIDIEDLNKGLCAKTGEPCENIIAADVNSRPLHIIFTKSHWLRPTSLTQLYSMIKQYRTSHYRLVCGNTGQGVQHELALHNYEVLIDTHGITDLYQISVSKPLIIGANVTLSDMVDIFRQNYHQIGFGYLKDFADHFSRIGNIHVRNMACWAGNLMMKNKLYGFPSDLFLMFEAAGASVVIGDDGTTHTYKIMDFLTVDMNDKVILQLLLPAAGKNVHIQSFKVMMRSQNSHAFVNASFKMEIDNAKNYTVTAKPVIVYGGINSKFIHASKTEAFLVGKALGDPAILKGALNMLNSEVGPNSNPVMADPQYRKNLALNLFYKFVLGRCPNKVDARFKSGAHVLARPLSSGKQSFDSNKSEWPLNEPVMKLEAEIQTSGEAEYISDIPLRHGELHGAFVLTTVAKAKIKTIDAAEAMSVPGVVRFVSVQDIPPTGINNFFPDKPPVFIPEEVFCSGYVIFSGQAVGLILAEEMGIAQYAARKVKITYYDFQTPILTVDEAIKQGSLYPRPGDDIVKGNAEAAIASSPRKLSGIIRTEGQYHFHTETQVSVCTPTDDGFDIQTSTQYIDAAQQVVSQVLDIPTNSINISVRRIGGGFGAKINRNFQVVAACAIAANSVRRPVRVWMDIQSNMAMIGKRYPYRADYEVGFNPDGKLNGVKITYHSDCGCTDNDNSVNLALMFGDNAYDCPNWHLIPKAVRTDMVSNTYVRSPGSSQGVLIMESIMEHVAKDLKMDPTEVRKLNMYKKGQKTPIGMTLDYCSIRDITAKLETSASLSSRKQQIAAFNQANRWKKKGISVVPLKYGVEWGFSSYNVHVTIYHVDGMVGVAHAGIELGQGINTKVAQVCAYALGIPLSFVRVKPTDSFTSSNSSTTGGSITSELNCKAALLCCQELKKRMAPVKARMPGASWSKLVFKCFEEGIDLSTKYWLEADTNQVFKYNSYGVTCTELELDVLTGENQVTRVDILFDCGESLSPEIDIGQVEGAFVMGLGYMLLEKLRYDPKNGRLLTDSTWEYKPPATKDIPIDFRIELLKNAPNPLGVLRSKASGEPPFCMACSCLFALKHAIEAARKEIKKDDFFPLYPPATYEVAQLKCLTDPTQLTYN